MTNPYAVTSDRPARGGVFGTARRHRGGFLYRVIDIDQPLQTRLVYSGWWFVQRLSVDRRLVWWKISWLRIERRIEVRLPVEVDPRGRRMEVVLDFGPALWIKRFQISLDGVAVYDGP